MGDWCPVLEKTVVLSSCEASSSRWITLGLFDPEYEGTVILQTVGNHLPSDTASHKGSF